jgi:repressor LexA
MPTPPAAADLTPRQARLLDALRAYIDQHGYPPTIRELGPLAGFRSKGGVVYQLERLAEKGAIRRDPAVPRALVVLDRDTP